MVGKVAATPELRFADDLNDEQLKQHMPLVHCRECNSMGWAGVKRQHDSAVSTDLQGFYLAFFKNDPQGCVYFSGRCRASRNSSRRPVLQTLHHLHPSSPLSFQPKAVLIADNRKCSGYLCPTPGFPAATGNRVGTHHCPYCGARNGLTILGSRGRQPDQCADCPNVCIHF